MKLNLAPDSVRSERHAMPVQPPTVPPILRLTEGTNIGSVEAGQAWMLDHLRDSPEPSFDEAVNELFLAVDENQQPLLLGIQQHSIRVVDNEKHIRASLNRHELNGRLKMDRAHALMLYTVLDGERGTYYQSVNDLLRDDAGTRCDVSYQTMPSTYQCSMLTV